MAYKWETFGIAIAVNSVITVICLWIFNRLRLSKRYQRFYAPRRYVKSSGYARPRLLPEGTFAWMRQIFHFTDDEMLSIAGYDGLMYLKTFSFGLRLFGVLSVIILVSVLPTNWTGDLVDENQRKRQEEGGGNRVENTEFDKVTMANVKDESHTLWVHLIATWFVTLFTLSLLIKFHKEAVDLRIEFLSTAKKGAESHTVFIRDLPGIRFGHPLDRLMNSFIFKLLPSSIKKRIQSSLDAMSNMANQQINKIGSSLTTAISQGTGPSRVGMDDRLMATTSNESAQRPFKRPQATDITDMEPDQWVLKRLQDHSPDEVVELMFKEVFPQGEVTGAFVVRNTSTLEPLVGKLNNAVQQLEDNLDEYARKIRNEEKVEAKKTRIIPIAEGKWATEKYGQKPVKIDLLEYLVMKISHLKTQILEEQEKAMNAVTGSAFVGFSSRWSQVVGATSFFHHFERYWNAEAAPNPQEIVWENLKWRTWEQSIRTLTIWFAFIMLCMFYMVPVGAIQAVLQVDELEDVAVLGDIIKFPIVNSVLVAILPQLVLTIFLAILPTLLAMMNHYQGFISKSAIDFEVTRKYFIFQIIIVFLANFGILSITDQFDQLKDDPSSIMNILAASAVRSSHFFLYYILTNALISAPVELLQVPGLIITWILTKFAGTQRAKDRVWQTKQMMYGRVVTGHSLILFLGLVFSVVSPIILPAALVYFIAVMCYNRYQMLYIQSEAYKSGGKLWTQVYNHVIIALIFFHLMMIGILTLKKFPYAALLIPLPLITIGFNIMVGRLFYRPLNMLSLRAARDLDTMDEVQERKELLEEAEHEDTDIQDAYLNDCFKIDWTQIDTACAEVIRVKEALGKSNEEAIQMVSNLQISQPVELYDDDQDCDDLTDEATVKKMKEKQTSK